MSDETNPRFVDDPRRLDLLAELFRAENDPEALRAEADVQDIPPMPLELEVRIKTRELSGQLRRLDPNLSDRHATAEAARILRAKTDDTVRMAAYSRLLDEYGEHEDEDEDDTSDS